MASEPKSPDQRPNEPDKSRRSRSFGSFVLFLFILIVVLTYVSSSSMSGTEKLTQDEYLWNLYTGRIVDQEFKGTKEGSNRIEGRYRREGDPGREREFETSFADAEKNEERFRELKARSVYGRITEQVLLDAIDQGFYEPREAISLTRFKDPDVKPQKTRLFGAPPEPEVEDTALLEEEVRKEGRDEKLLVEVVADARSSWTGDGTNAEGEAAAPPFPLPEQSSHLWFEVVLDDVQDLSALLGSLEAGGTQMSQLEFDLTPNRGTRFAEASNLLYSVLVIYGPWILIFAVIMIVMRQMRSQGGAGGVMSFGRSRAQLYSKENRTNVTFDDVAGADEAKAEVREIVEFLKNPGRFTRIGGRIPRGVLLVGSPGCGKTLLAKAIAGEAEVPFFSISGSDFVEMFVGVGASRVRDLFKQARDNSPCIIFLDEIDAVGRRRGSGMGGGHDEREQTLNAILVEMDGFGTDEGIIVIAATNRPDVLDPALLRPGRFDREVTIELPDVEGRAAILGVHLKRVKSSDEVDVSTLAKSTPGYSGADLAAIVNEAAIMAVLAKREEILMEDLEEARDKVRYGRQKISRNIEEEDRKITAYHEAGHAVVAASIPEVDPPHKITIVPRGRALGSTMVLPDKESYHMQKKRLVGQLAMLFGGRVAEAEFCGDISAGASDDIRRATDLARAMVTELGMSETIGPINYAERQGSDFLGTELMRGKSHSEQKAHEIDAEVHRILTEAYERAEGIIRDKRSVIEELTRALLDYETVAGPEMVKLMEGATALDIRPKKPDTNDDAAPAAPTPTPPAENPAEGNARPGDLPGTPGFSPA